AKGLPLINLISIDPRETVTGVLAAPESDFGNGGFLYMATRRGEIKKTPLREFASVRSSGLIAMDLAEGDELAWVCYHTGSCEIILVTEQGQSLRMRSDAVPARSRTAGGVRAIKLASDDRVCAMSLATGRQLLVVTANGFAKRTKLDEYPVQGRGGQGVRTIRLTQRTGPVAAADVVTGSESLLLISSSGLVLRTAVSEISEQGRAAQGVSVMDLRPGDRVVGLAVLDGNDAAGVRRPKG
ncbi:MAG TPA: DNA gyrase C-terminal beta-propeller domain-containing protein, partial [Chloroflexota bacterium]